MDGKFFRQMTFPAFELTHFFFQNPSRRKNISSYYVQNGAFLGYDVLRTFTLGCAHFGVCMTLELRGAVSTIT